jgi:hypothetical protein
MFLHKVHVENFPQKKWQKFRCEFFLDFLFYRVFGCFSAMGVKKHHRKRFTKKSCRKAFIKKSTKQSKTDCFLFLDLFYHVLGRFTARAVQKRDKKYRENKSDTGPFLASDPPTHHGGH